MRLILTTHQFLPEHASGTEILTLSTAKELRRRGHDVSIFTASPTTDDLADDQRFDSYEYDGLPVDRFRWAPVPMGGQTNLTEMEFDAHLVRRRFRALLERERPHLVHFFHLGRLSSSPLDACRELRIPAFFTPTDFWCVCPTCQLRLPGNAPCPGPDPGAVNCMRHMAPRARSPLARALRRMPVPAVALAMLLSRHLPPIHPWIGTARAVARRRECVVSRINRLDAVFVPTLLMESILADNGVLRERMVRCPFGIDPIPATPRRPPERGGALRVGYIGGLAEHKGVHLLLQAVRGMAEDDLDIRIYGSPVHAPAYAEELRRIASGDTRISFRGTFPNAEIGRVFAGLDVLVVPSIWHENTPLVLASAQACACPIVASDVGGISEVVRHEENGLLFPAGDVAALQAALGRLARDRAALGRLSASRRMPRSTADYVDQLEQVYRRTRPPAAATARMEAP